MFRLASTTYFTLLIPALLASPSFADSPPKTSATSAADLFQRGWKYEQGNGVPIDTPEAIRCYTEAAKFGDPIAKGRLARIYFAGNGVQQDKDKAEQYVEGIFPAVLKEAEKNNAIAQALVATMYSDGLGVARDNRESLKWERKAADQGLPLAQSNLAVSYENGIGVPKDQVEAAKWFRKAADQNYAVAQAYLGDMHRWGKGVLQDDGVAFQLFSLSAAQNFAHAQNNLAYMYEHGCCVACNVAEAVNLYQKAANQNFAVAQTNLGIMYENGCGVPQDIRVALFWFHKAADQDDENAICALRRYGIDRR